MAPRTDNHEVILGQVVAIEHGLRDKTERQYTERVRQAHNKQLVAGIHREDHPFEGYPQFQGEQKLVQANTEAIIDDVREWLGHLFNVTATKDFGNTQARADVTVEGHVLLRDAPVPFLLFLEGMFTDLIVEFGKVQVQPTHEKWEPVPGVRGEYRTAERQTPRLAKVKEWRKYVDPTQYHPAELREVTEDKQIGTWHERLFTGALTYDRKQAILKRLRTLLDAVKYARVQANTTKIPQREVAAGLLAYAFDGTLGDGATS